MGLLEILTLVFVVGKLFGVIGWSWWLVFLPMYPALLVYGLLVIGGLLGFRKVSKEFKDMM